MRWSHVCILDGRVVHDRPVMDPAALTLETKVVVKRVCLTERGAKVMGAGCIPLGDIPLPMRAAVGGWLVANPTAPRHLAIDVDCCELSEPFVDAVAEAQGETPEESLENGSRSDKFLSEFYEYFLTVQLGAVDMNDESLSAVYQRFVEAPPDEPGFDMVTNSVTMTVFYYGEGEEEEGEEDEDGWVEA